MLTDDTIHVLDHGFVRLDDAMASDLSVANAARVSFARRKQELDDADAGLIRFLMRERHGCYDDATDVLTAEGWKSWPSVTGDELFATRSRQGALEYQPGLRMVRKEYRGHMIGFKGMSIDMLVTPDHQMLASATTTRETRKTPSFSLVPAHSLLWRPHRHVTTASWAGADAEWLTFDDLSFAARPFLRLVGLFIGDGNLGRSNHITFRLRKQREISFLEQVVSGSGLELKRWGADRYAIPVLPEMRAFFAACYETGEKVIPRRLLWLGPALLEALLDGLMNSDGTRSERPGKADRLTYSTTSPRLANDVQELALKLGRSASVREHKARSGDGHFGSKPRWRLTIYNARNTRPELCRTSADADNHMGVENYDGAIHCVEVPNHTLYVRRNGYAAWSGNTPFEHNAFRFHVRCPIFVAREWFRHRVGCLTGDTVVTFVDTNGHATQNLRKTIDELWRMWNVGERDGHALEDDQRGAIDRLVRAGRSQRAVARQLRIGRRAIRTHVAGATGLRDARWRLRRMRVRVLDEATGEFGVGHVCDVIEKGVQPVYRLTLADGKELTLTENHRILTSNGWLRMREAVGLIGDGASATMSRPCALMVNGAVAHRDRDWLAARRQEGKSVAEIAADAGCSYHTIRKWLALHNLRFAAEERRGREPWNKGLSGYRTGMVVGQAHREAIREARSSERSNFWRGGVTPERASIGRWTREQAPRVHAQYDYECQECSRRGARLHAHHIVPVWLGVTTAREIGNLITVCDSCHRKIHRTPATELDFARRHGGRVGFARDIDIPLRRGFKLTAHAVEVTSISSVGFRQTFDLAIDGPWHNFVANGIVVHNSFNEFSMRYAKATDDFYVPAPEDVRTQVGKPGAYTFETVDPELAEQTRNEMRGVYEAAFATYERLVEQGIAREVARAVLPVGAYTEFYWTINARSLMNFVSLRSAETAQREIRRYAEAVERFLEQHMPITHAAFVANDRMAP